MADLRTILTRKKPRRTTPAVMERRALVAGLLKRHITYTEMATQLGVSRVTISKDVSAIKEQWREAAVDDVASMKGRELVELDEMERECALEYASAKKHDERVKWMSLRLDIKRRRAKMMGLDDPVVQINVDLIDRNLRDLSDSELNGLLVSLAKDNPSMLLDITPETDARH